MVSRLGGREKSPQQLQLLHFILNQLYGSRMSNEPENIDKIRDILFGEQIRSTEASIDSVRAEIVAEIQQLKDSMEKRFDEMDKNLVSLEEKLKNEDAKIREVHVERKKLATMLRSISDKLSPETK